MNTCARIATICQANACRATIEENRAAVLGQVDLALQHHPDLVCLPETFTTSWNPTDLPRWAETVPGPTTDLMAGRARANNCYIVCPLLTQEEGRVHNSAVVIGRQGDIVGRYDKRQPVTSSSDYTVAEHGVTPGTTDGLFDLDFGRVGIRICFDVGFADDWAELARAGARLVLWPSAYDGGEPLTAYAVLHRYYVVTSVRTNRSRIIDPCGSTLAATDSLLNFAVRDINLDYVVCHSDFNHGIPERIMADYAGRVDVRMHFEAGSFIVEPKDPAVTCAELMTKYGFESTQTYHQRHREAIAALVQGKTPPPQTARHRNRAMHSK